MITERLQNDCDAIVKRLPYDCDATCDCKTIAELLQNGLMQQAIAKRLKTLEIIAEWLRSDGKRVALVKAIYYGGAGLQPSSEMVVVTTTFAFRSAEGDDYQDDVLND
jgi:hypothetical protein